MKLKDGGEIDNLKKGKISDITFANGDCYIFEMWINGDCLSYLSLPEILTMRDEINQAIKKSINTEGR
jgi:hypothetical protein